MLNGHLGSKKALFWTLGALCQVLGAMGQKHSQSHCRETAQGWGARRERLYGLCSTELVEIPEVSSPELSLDPCPMLGGSRQEDLPKRGVKMGRQGATLSLNRDISDISLCVGAHRNTLFQWLSNTIPSTRESFHGVGIFVDRNVCVDIVE